MAENQEECGTLTSHITPCPLSYPMHETGDLLFPTTGEPHNFTVAQRQSRCSAVEEPKGRRCRGCWHHVDSSARNLTHTSGQAPFMVDELGWVNGPQEFSLL